MEADHKWIRKTQVHDSVPKRIRSLQFGILYGPLPLSKSMHDSSNDFVDQAKISSISQLLKSLTAMSTISAGVASHGLSPRMALLTVAWAPRAEALPVIPVTGSSRTAMGTLVV